jgi:hypothetical protein
MSSQALRIVLSVILAAEFLFIGFESRSIENETDSEVGFFEYFDQTYVLDLQVYHSIDNLFVPIIQHPSDFECVLSKIHSRCKLFSVTSVEAPFGRICIRIFNCILRIPMVPVVYVAFADIPAYRKLLFSGRDQNSFGDGMVFDQIEKDGKFDKVMNHIVI